MSETEDGTDRDPISEFLATPARHYDEDDEPAAGQGDGDASIVHMNIRQRFRRFMFEKQPSGYSSLSPRKPDGRRTKIFFFNGNGRGR